MIKTILKLFQKNLFLNIMCLIQMTICLLCINFLILLNFNNSYIQNVTADIFNKQVIAVQHQFKGLGNTTSGDIVDVLGKLKGLDFVENAYSLGVTSNSGDIFSLYGINEKFADIYKPKMNKGVWISENKRANITPAIGSTKMFKLGEVVTINSFEQNISVEIIGLFDETLPFFAMTTGSYPMTYESLFKTDVKRVDLIMFEKDLNFANIPYDNDAKTLFFFNDNISDDDMSYNFALLNNDFNAYTKDMLDTNSKDDQKIYNAYILPIAISYGLVTLVSFAAFVLIINSKTKKDFYCMKVCGMKPSKEILLKVLVLFLIYIPAAILSLVFLKPIFKWLGLTSYIGFCAYNILFVVSMFVYMVISTIIITKKGDKNANFKIKKSF